MCSLLLSRCRYSCCGLRCCRRRHITGWRPCQKLSSDNHYNREENPQTNKTARYTIRVDQFLCKRCNVKGRSSVPAYNQTGNQASSMRSEPFQSSRGRSSIADSHADASQDSEAEDQT